MGVKMIVRSLLTVIGVRPHVRVKTLFPSKSWIEPLPTGKLRISDSVGGGLDRSDQDLRAQRSQRWGVLKDVMAVPGYNVKQTRVDQVGPTVVDNDQLPPNRREWVNIGSGLTLVGLASRLINALKNALKRAN